LALLEVDVLRTYLGDFLLRLAHLELLPRFNSFLREDEDLDTGDNFSGIGEY